MKVMMTTAMGRPRRCSDDDVVRLVDAVELVAEAGIWSRYSTTKSRMSAPMFDPAEASSETDDGGRRASTGCAGGHALRRAMVMKSSCSVAIDRFARGGSTRRSSRPDDRGRIIG